MRSSKMGIEPQKTNGPHRTKIRTKFQSFIIGSPVANFEDTNAHCEVCISKSFKICINRKH